MHNNGAIIIHIIVVLVVPRRGELPADPSHAATLGSGNQSFGVISTVR